MSLRKPILLKPERGDLPGRWKSKCKGQVTGKSQPGHHSRKATLWGQRVTIETPLAKHLLFMQMANLKVMLCIFKDQKDNLVTVPILKEENVLFFKVLVYSHCYFHF